MTRPTAEIDLKFILTDCHGDIESAQRRVDRTIDALKAERDKWKEEYENLCKFATDFENERDQLKAQLAEAVKTCNWIVNNACSWGLESEPYVTRARECLEKLK